MSRQHFRSPLRGTPRLPASRLAVPGLMISGLLWCGCWWPPRADPGGTVPDRRTVVEEHSTTQAPGSPHTLHERLPAPVTPPPRSGAEEGGEEDAPDAE